MKKEKVYFQSTKFKYLILIIAIICIIFLVMLFIKDINSIKNPADDAKNYNKYVHSNYLLNVFPKRIPESAENVHFIYSPGFLQGGTSYILYYKDKNIDLTSFDKKYIAKTIWVGYVSEIDEDNVFKEEEVNKLTDDDFYNTPIETNKDFKIYLFDYQCDTSGWCNHGKYLFAAINEKSKEVVYKSETW